LEEMRRADGNDDDVSLTCQLSEVAAAAMADSYSCIGIGGFLHQDQCQRFANNVAAADDYDVRPVQPDATPHQQLLDAMGRTRQIARMASSQQAKTLRAETVHILERQNGANNRVLANLIR